VTTVLSDMNLVSDERGKLTFGEEHANLPFAPVRYFMVYDVPIGTVRGGHAHKACHQFLIAVAGSVMVMTDDGVTRSEVLLDRPDRGLHIPPLVWSEQRYEGADSRLLVMASERYDESDYIRDHDDFRSLRGPAR